MKIRPVGLELFRADGRTDVTKLRVSYRNFSNAPTNRPGRWDTSDVLTELIVKICRFGTKLTERLPALPSRRRTEIPRTVGTHTTSCPAMPCSDFQRSALKTQRYNSHRTDSFTGAF